MSRHVVREHIAPDLWEKRGALVEVRLKWRGEKNNTGQRQMSVGNRYIPTNW
jgi:hypothetical protein